MSQDTAIRQRTSRNKKCTQTFDVPPVYFFSLVSPQIYLIITLAYIIMAAVWYSPDQIPVAILNTPILGNLVWFLISYPILNLGFIWLTIIAHIVESYFAIKFCWKHNFSISSTALYIAQTLYCGGFCLRVLFRYNPSKY